MKPGDIVMATKLSGNFQGIFALGEEIVGPLERELTIGDSIMIKPCGKHEGIISSNITELKKLVM